MGGSRRPSIYETDIPAGEGQRKFIVINGDESNARLFGGVAATAANIAGRTAASEGVDYIRIEPRYVLLQGKLANGELVRRKLTVYDPTIALFTAGGTVSMSVSTGADTNESVTFSVTGMVGEKRTVVPALLDTGLTDGTAA